MDFKDLIYRRRKELGLTMEDVAKVVGVSKATVKRWESGEIENIKRDKIVSLANALHTTPAYLMGWVDNDTSDIELSKDERKLVLAYREHPEMQDAVNKLLGIDDNSIIADDIVETINNAKKVQPLIKKEQK